MRRAVVNDYRKVFEEEKIDCLLTPVVSDDPMTLAEYEKSDSIFSNDDLFTVGANLAGPYPLTWLSERCLPSLSLAQVYLHSAFQ